jgi:peptide/nickel transport system permease protein
VRRFLLARLLQSIAVVAVVATVAFALIRLAPGEPFAFEGVNVPPAARARLKAEFGYDRPMAVQYVAYVRNVARGELGFSPSHRRPVGDVIATYLPRTALLTGVALLIATIAGILIGAWHAARRRTAAARITSTLMLAVYSIPDFFLSMLLILIFARWAGILPAGGMQDAVLYEYLSGPARMLDRLEHLVLPVTALVLLTTTVIARQQSAALLDVLPLDYVRLARAKGVSEAQVVRRHALRNALSPVIALSGVLLPALLGGAFFVEQVFAWPGMGTMTIDAIAARDYELVTASVLVGGILVTAGSLVADLVHALIDPRLRAG